MIFSYLVCKYDDLHIISEGCIILFIYWWILFAKALSNIFSVYIPKYLSVDFFFLLVYIFSGFGNWLMSTSGNMLGHAGE